MPEDPSAAPAVPDEEPARPQRGALPLLRRLEPRQGRALARTRVRLQRRLTTIPASGLGTCTRGGRREHP